MDKNSNSVIHDITVSAAKRSCETLGLRILLILCVRVSLIRTSDCQKCKKNMNYGTKVVVRQRKSKINVEKRKSITMGNGNNTHVTELNGHIIELVKRFKYFGTANEENGKLNRE